MNNKSLLNNNEFFTPQKRKKSGRPRQGEIREKKTARINTSITENQFSKLKVLAEVQNNSVSDTLGLIIDWIYKKYIFSLDQDECSEKNDREPGLILESLLYDLEYDLINHEEIMGCISISGSDGWMYSDSDSYKIILLPCLSAFTFSADVTLRGEWKGETSILGTSISATISGKAEQAFDGWRIAEWSLVECRMYPMDSDQNCPDNETDD